MEIDSQLIPIKEWIATHYPDNPPSLATVRRWCINGDIMAKQIGRPWYVESNQSRPLDKKPHSQWLSISNWAALRFKGKAPDLGTVRRWCEEQQLPARRTGKLWFIDINAEMNETGDELADLILNG